MRPCVAMTTSRLLVPADAAEYLSERGLTITDETLRRWASTAKVRHVRLPSGQIRFRPDDLDALLIPVEPGEGSAA